MSSGGGRLGRLFPLLRELRAKELRLEGRASPSATAYGAKSAWYHLPKGALVAAAGTVREGGIMLGLLDRSEQWAATTTIGEGAFRTAVRGDHRRPISDCDRQQSPRRTAGQQCPDYRGKTGRGFKFRQNGVWDPLTIRKPVRSCLWRRTPGRLFPLLRELRARNCALKASLPSPRHTAQSRLGSPSKGCARSGSWYGAARAASCLACSTSSAAVGSHDLRLVKVHSGQTVEAPADGTISDCRSWPTISTTDSGVNHVSRFTEVGLGGFRSCRTACEAASAGG